MREDGAKVKYNVGGIMLDRPFKAGRLGHYGIFPSDTETSVAFYGDLLGFKVTDKLFPNPADPSMQLTFLTYGADHHALVLAPLQWADGDADFKRGVTVNQISFQVGSLEEMINAHKMLRDHDTSIFRIGRDIPGSNWAVYCRDPDGYLIELYYGMEQIGWDGRTKPAEFLRYAVHEEPSLPQPSERDELDSLEHDQVNLASGHRALDPIPAKFYVGGVLLPRPFKIIRTGPVELFVQDVEKSKRFYTEEMGFTLTEEVMYAGHKCAFFRTAGEHHSIGLIPLELREQIGLTDKTTLMSFGMQVATYQQLKDAASFLKEKGCTLLDIPAELHPGIDYAIHFLDPDGHCIRLFYYMEQVGWDGSPRPAASRRKVVTPWPETLDAFSDTYADRTFQGPLG